MMKKKNINTRIWSQLIIVIIILLLNCTSHRTSLIELSDTSYQVYSLPENEIFRMVYNIILKEVKDGTIENYNQDGLKGYQVLVKMMFDRATIKVTIIPVIGNDANGTEVNGFYVDITSHGSYRPKEARHLTTMINEQLLQTNTAIQIFSLSRGTYISDTKDSNTDDTFQKIKKLKELHDQGILTDEEFKTKKMELLEEI